MSFVGWSGLAGLAVAFFVCPAMGIQAAEVEQVYRGIAGIGHGFPRVVSDLHLGRELGSVSRGSGDDVVVFHPGPNVEMPLVVENVNEVLNRHDCSWPHDRILWPDGSSLQGWTNSPLSQHVRKIEIPPQHVLLENPTRCCYALSCGSLAVINNRRDKMPVSYGALWSKITKHRGIEVNESPDGVLQSRSRDARLFLCGFELTGHNPGLLAINPELQDADAHQAERQDRHGYGGEGRIYVRGLYPTPVFMRPLVRFILGMLTAIYGFALQISASYQAENGRRAFGVCLGLFGFLLIPLGFLVVLT
jgi:hypothetical protein